MLWANGKYEVILYSVAALLENERRFHTEWTDTQQTVNRWEYSGAWTQLLRRIMPFSETTSLLGWENMQTKERHWWAQATTLAMVRLHVRPFLASRFFIIHSISCRLFLSRHANNKNIPPSQNRHDEGHAFVFIDVLLWRVMAKSETLNLFWCSVLYYFLCFFFSSIYLFNLSKWTICVIVSQLLV